MRSTRFEARGLGGFVYGPGGTGETMARAVVVDEVPAPPSPRFIHRAGHVLAQDLVWSPEGGGYISGP